MAGQRVQGIQIREGVEMRSSITNRTFSFQCGDVLNTDSGMALFVALLHAWCWSAHGVFLQICQCRSVLGLMEHINGSSGFGFLHSDFLELFSGQ